MILAIIIIALLFALLMIVFVIIRNGKFQDEYFQRLDLKLTGVLVRDPECPNVSNGFCILDVKIITTNIERYNPVGKDRYYYAIIDGDRARLFQEQARNLKEGDTIAVDTRKRIFLCVNRQVSLPLKIYTSDQFYEKINK